MDIIFQHDLHAKAQVIEDADQHQHHRHRDQRVGDPADDAFIVQPRQADQAEQQPQHQQQIADGGVALRQPVVRAMLGRAKAADAADTSSGAHQNAFPKKM